MKNKKSRLERFITKHKTTLIKHIALHCVLFIVLLIVIFSTRIEKIDNGTRMNIYVEDKEYVSGLSGTFRIEPRCYFYSNGDRYQIAKNVLRTAKEQYNEINIGDTIEVTYVEKSNIFGEYRYVIDAKKSDGTLLVDYNSYYSEASTVRNIFLILLIVIELLCVGISLFYFYIIR